MTTRSKGLEAPFSAYARRDTASVDEELVRVGRGTPCGEYLRRFWQPVALSSDLGDTPLAIRIMGEDLVAFRDLGGNVGLLERRCCHRGTSLEFAVVRERGIQCCYHGWRFDVDGTILETPGEPPDSRIRDRTFQGAYPAREYHGIVFAYMGPPDAAPEFPIYDLFVRPGVGFAPAKVHSPCNWLQVRENEMDPIHIVFLHTRLFGVQFTEALGEMPVIEWRETPVGMMYLTTRRHGAYLYLRSNDMVLPNIARVAGVEDAGGETIFDRRGGTTNWVVPIDDTNSLTIGWDDVEEILPDPRRDGYLDRMTLAGNDPMSPFDVGQTGEPSYAERQSAPGDWDAWVSQGPITIHGREHLASTDRGVALYRNLLRRGIRAVQAGEEPKGIVRHADGPIATYGHNTVRRVAPAATADEEQALWLAFGRDFTDTIMDLERRDALVAGMA